MTNTLLFKAGDRVIYTNEYGAEFRRRVTGIYLPKGDCPLYARGYRYLLNNDSYWMPVRQENLRIDNAPDDPH